MARAAYLLLSSSLVAMACGGKHSLTSSPDGETASEVDAGTSSDAEVDASASSDTGVDTGTSPAPPPLSLQSCDELAAGGVPDALSYFEWIGAQVGECADGHCGGSVAFLGPSCAVKINGSDLELAPDDCVAARSWASNLRFLGVLRTGFGCDPGPQEEIFSYGLNSGSSAYRDTNWCPEPTIESVRTCLRGLIARL